MGPDCPPPRSHQSGAVLRLEPRFSYFQSRVCIPSCLPWLPFPALVGRGTLSPGRLYLVLGGWQQGESYILIFPAQISG